MKQHMKTSDRYVKFMGSWMAGEAVGRLLGSILAKIIIIWVLYKFFISSGFYKECLHIIFK